MVKTLKDIVTFFKVSPIQQVASLALAAPATILVTYDAIKEYQRGNIISSAISTMLTLFCIGTFIYNESYAVKNMREYNKVKSALDKHGWDERIIKTKCHLKCQRIMVQVASDDAGFGEETRDYLYKKGFRWYHTYLDD